MGNRSLTPAMLVVIAALNEEEGIGLSLAELHEVLDDAKYLIVDGQSIDRTVEVAKDMGARVLIQEGSGKGQAIAQAIKSIDASFDYVILTDADYTYPAKSVPEMVRILEENPKVGMVIGNRFHKSFSLNSVRDPFYVGNRVLALAQRFLNGVNLTDPLSGLRVIRWQILKNWNPRSTGFDIEAEMNHLVERKGYRFVEVPIQYRSRLGEKKLKMRHGVAILRRIVSESLRH